MSISERLSWSMVELARRSDSEWVGRGASHPNELVHKFIDEFFSPLPQAFAALPSGDFHPVREDGSPAAQGVARVRLAAKLAAAGAKGFQLLVATSRSSREIVEWLQMYGYGVVTEQTASPATLFDSMFPNELMSRALQRMVLEGQSALVGFAHDADPIWVVKRLLPS